MKAKNSYPLGWRDYQKELKRTQRKKALVSKLPKWSLYVGCGFTCLILVFLAGHWILEQMKPRDHHPKETEEPSKAPAKPPEREDFIFELKDLSLDPTNLDNHFVVEKDGVPLIVETSIDPGLQDSIQRLLERSRTLQAAVVVLRPDDGRILAMVSHDEGGTVQDLCLKASFPAASLFKIISAAAALEGAGYTPEKSVFYHGRKYTLYKKQLKKTMGKYTTKTSFRKAFASSINPVFGKLGIYDLGQSVLTDTAEKFLFNRNIPFDLPVEKSFISVPEDEFGLAEIATGFNKETLISPLHAALLTSAVVNDGVMMAPWLLKSISKEDGEVVYVHMPKELTSPISPKTSKDLRTLMQDTVRNGTCRKCFRKVRGKKAFRGVVLGAKTGTINDKMDRYKYDWLAAYALPPDGAKGICIAVMGIHGKKLGIRANELGRHIISYYLSS